MQLFKDNSGQWSMTRALSAFIVVDVMITWTVTCIASGAMQDFTVNQVALIGTSIGLKVLQKGKEI